MDLLSKLEAISRPVWILIGIATLCGVGFVDYATGYEISFSLFYLAPIGLVTWFTDQKTGIVLAIGSAGVWLVADISAGAVYSSSLIHVWNALIRLVFFVLAVFSIRVGKRLDQEKALARTDSVTGTANTRFFHLLAQREIHRSARSGAPMTIAFVDIDDFKNVNDRFGHLTGDRVLIVVAECMVRQLRKTDIVARVGGDEFAVLLPEVGSETARLVIPKLRAALSGEMRNNAWPVTFSIGVVTFQAAPESPDEMLGLADTLMYEVKRHHKNDIRYATHPDPGTQIPRANKGDDRREGRSETTQAEVAIHDPPGR